MSNLIDKIMAYEQGELDEEDTIALFQGLVDSGDVWKLQGSYGRTAVQLIEAGLVVQQERPSVLEQLAAEVTELWARGRTLRMSRPTRIASTR